MWPFRRRTKDRALFQVGDIPVASTWAGVPVTPDSALRLAAVWSCVQLLAGSVSTLPVDVYRAGEREPLPTPALLRQPAARTPLPDWLHQAMVSLLLRGNTYGVITARSGATMLPSQVELVHPDRVGWQLDPDQRTVTWRLDGSEIDREDLWHVKGFSLPGSPEGLSPIQYMRQGIGLAAAAEQYGARLFGSGSMLGGVLQTDAELDEPKAEELKARWHAKLAGLGHAHEIAVLDSGAKFQPISIPPDQAQFLESRKFSVLEICRVFGVPPELVAAASGDSMTYANIEGRDLSFLKYSMAPWLVRLETGLTDLLPRNTYAKFNTGALLRTDLRTRYESYKLGLEGGWLTLDEIRELEDRPPLPATEPEEAAA
jgi:HK97 family phage portal protein